MHKLVFDLGAGFGIAVMTMPINLSAFHITAASEVMAILCLSSDMADLECRLGNTPITAHDVQASTGMAALLKDAFMPNLVQTLEHSPAILHGGYATRWWRRT